MRAKTQNRFDRRVSPIDRIKASIDIDANGCWLWKWRLSKKGYAHMSVAGKKRYAHRIAYECLIGAVPDSLELDHLCRVRRCCNPWHLEAVTHVENLARGANAKRARCWRGHEYSDANTYVDSKGRRACRACNVIRSQKYKARLESRAGDTP